MPEPDPNRILPFSTPAKFGTWLKNHHDSETEIWVKIFKKASGQKTLSWEKAVIEALCWGWIDSVKKTFDEDAYIQRFTPRKKGSNWSKRNREHVERLVAENRMQEPGLVPVRAAQADGRWPLGAGVCPAKRDDHAGGFFGGVSWPAQGQPFF